MNKPKIKPGDRVRYTKRARRNYALSFKAGCRRDDIKTVSYLGTSGVTVGLTDGTVETLDNVRIVYWYEKVYMQGFWEFIHNLIAHPLLVTKTKWADRFHEWTAQRM